MNTASGPLRASMTEEAAWADAVDFDFAAWQRTQLARVEKALEARIPASAPGGLGAAMRYAVLGGGKRLRPLLVLGAAEAVGAAQGEAALAGACAVEMIHAYSLVHDDLPAMDNDVLRRGLPTAHVKFGEALAMLAGDALQAQAFEVLTPEGAGIAPGVQARQVAILSRAAGCFGMAGGQAIDLASVGRSLDESQLVEMHRLKTGALLAASVALGAACGPEVSPAARAALDGYGRALGLAYQIVDDILDVTADSATIGKTAGKDALAHKPTYVSVLGLEPARERARALYEEALGFLEHAELSHPEALRALAGRLVARSC